MNIHTAKLFLPLVQALADGKTIQGHASAKHDWVDFEVGEEVEFTDPPDHYRIKPVPFECWVSIKDGKPFCATATYAGAPSCFKVIKMREIVE